MINMYVLPARRRFYTIFTLIFLLGCSSEQEEINTMKHAIQNRLVSAPSGAEVSVAYENLQTGSKMFINAKKQMHAASTYKTALMVEVYKQAAEGKISLTDSIDVINSFKSIVDNSEYAMDIGEDSDDSVYELIGKRASYYDLTYQMITVSSNLATNLLINEVGAKNIMKTLKSIGIKEMQVLRGVEDLKAYELGLNNTTNAEDMLRLMIAIAKDEVVSPSACAEMRKILLAQVHNSKIPAKLPKEVKVAHKTGSITKIDHDVAIIYPPKGPVYALVVLTRGIKEHKDAEELIADISKIVYDRVAKK
ncbi:MAG: serine hydrolase [Candidatus Marinimicrobia bacterium]|nr:serine hydrolase [Candidatus Neomarinimicrobiota bacterium]